jgi:hypothetical protein
MSDEEDEEIPVEGDPFEEEEPTDEEIRQNLKALNRPLEEYRDELLTNEERKTLILRQIKKRIEETNQPLGDDFKQNVSYAIHMLALGYEKLKEQIEILRQEIQNLRKGESNE